MLLRRLREKTIQVFFCSQQCLLKECQRFCSILFGAIFQQDLKFEMVGHLAVISLQPTAVIPNNYLKEGEHDVHLKIQGIVSCQSFTVFNWDTICQKMNITEEDTGCQDNVGSSQQTGIVAKSVPQWGSTAVEERWVPCEVDRPQLPSLLLGNSKLVEDV
jgi:hypothetical protein